MALWSCGVAGSSEKLEPYLHYYINYGYITCCDGDLLIASSYWYIHQTVWSHGLAWSCNKLKTLCLHYHNT